MEDATQFATNVEATVEAISGQWRSEDMSLVNLVIPRESAYSCVFSIATAGCMQILDSASGQPAHLRPQAGAIRQCDELERRLRFFKEQMDKIEVEAAAVSNVHDGHARDPHALQVLEDRISKEEKDLRDATTALESLQNELNTINAQIAACDSFKALSTGANAFSGNAKTIMGVIPSSALNQLMRLVYRASRGNAIVKAVELPESALEKKREKKDGVVVAPKALTAFLTLTSSDMINKKLRAIAVSVGSQLIASEDVENAGGLLNYKNNLEQTANQMRATLYQTENRHYDIVNRLALTYTEDVRSVQTDKTVAVALNLFSYSESFLKGQGWVPTNDLNRLREAIAAGHLMGSGAQPIVEVVTTHKLTPPTHFRTSKYMEVFQMIVNSYGTPHYKEINPAVFTIVTFPYLFGIMFGDMGHGVLLALFAAALIIFEPKLIPIAKGNEMFQMIFSGRYLLFLMGLFAIYVGFLYNDFFGFSVGLFKSAYQWPQLPPNGPGGVIHPNYPSGHPSVKPDEPYAFGLDVAWAETENKLEFYNSVKMKSAVVVGVVQMTLGIVLSFMNKLYKKNFREIIFLVVPEIVFLTCTFGYMSLLIIIKWCTTWENTNLAPSLLETMTNFFLSPGDVKVELYAGQAGIQVVLLLVAFAMTPVMLLVTPILEKRDHARKTAERSGAYATISGAEEGHAGSHDDDDEHFDFGEVMIHYVIHTIEFVLGCVSNTASYLRLWALSLAHAQLSEVFFNFAFCLTLGMDNGIGIFTVVGTGVWLMATVGVLLGMESLSAFLHSLRLHWVEFQNKFYAADGIEFEPLTLPDE